MTETERSLLKNIKGHAGPQLIDAAVFQESLLNLQAKGLIERVGRGWVAHGWTGDTKERAVDRSMNHCSNRTCRNLVEFNDDDLCAWCTSEDCK